MTSIAMEPVGFEPTTTGYRPCSSICICDEVYSKFDCFGRFPILCSRSLSASGQGEFGETQANEVLSRAIQGKCNPDSIWSAIPRILSFKNPADKKCETLRRMLSPG